MPNYQNSKVYSIRSLSRPELIYVGSTTQPLSKRMGQHRTDKGCVSKEIIAIGDAYIELIENYPCVDKNQLLARENSYMRGLDCLNKHSAIDDCPHGKKQNQCVECHGRGICEHQKRRSECKDCGGSSICEHQKHRERCKDCGGSAICEHQKRRELCKDCGGSAICEHHRERRKCKLCSPVECEQCNITMSKGCYKQHLKSQTHIENIAPQ